MAAGKSLPVEKYRVTRRYREKTLILETQFDTKDGRVTLIDFMPIRSKTPRSFVLSAGNEGRCGCEWSSWSVLITGYPSRGSRASPTGH